MYLCKTELFEIELLICLNMDLALNNQQCLICYKTLTNKPTNKLLVFVTMFDVYFILAYIFGTLVSVTNCYEIISPSNFR